MQNMLQLQDSVPKYFHFIACIFSLSCRPRGERARGQSAHWAERALSSGLQRLPNGLLGASENSALALFIRGKDVESGDWRDG